MPTIKTTLDGFVATAKKKCGTRGWQKLTPSERRVNVSVEAMGFLAKGGCEAVAMAVQIQELDLTTVRPD